MHLYDPHAPYEPPPEYLEKAGRNAYDGEVAFADAQVGRLVEWLASSNLTGDTVIAIPQAIMVKASAITASSTHGMLVYDSTVRVPLVLVVPGQPPAVDDQPVSLVDGRGRWCTWLVVPCQAGCMPGRSSLVLRPRTRRTRKRNIRGALAGIRSPHLPTTGGS